MTDLPDISIESTAGWTWEQFVTYGQIFRGYKDMSQWALGDLASGVQKTYGEGSIEKYANAIGVPYKRLLEYRHTALAWKSEKRLPFMSYSHHKEALRAANPEEMLIKAHDNSWTVRQLERELGLERSVDCEHTVELSNRCTKCGKKFPIDNSVKPL